MSKESVSLCNELQSLADIAIGDDNRAILMRAASALRQVGGWPASTFAVVDAQRVKAPDGIAQISPCDQQRVAKA